MRTYKIQDFIGGWFLGQFEPSILKTANFEIAYHSYKKGQIWPDHFHKIAEEIVLVISGTISINGTLFTKGDIFTLSPNEISRSQYLTDVELIIIKIPSVPGDKYLV